MIAEDEPDPNANKNLYMACVKGNLCMVKKILSKGLADINHRGYFGRTPVMVAARNGHVPVFDFLLSQGSDLSVADTDNNTVIHLACKKGNTEIVRKLVENQNYDKQIRGIHGWTPLEVAAYYGCVDVFDFLVSAGCNPQTVRYLGKNILHLVSLGGHVDMVKHIVSLQYVDIDSEGPHGATAVLYAAMYGFVDVVDFLNRKRCNMAAVDQDKYNILHRSCLGGNVDMVKYCLKHDIVSMESRALNGYTPLMLAIVESHREVVDFLVKHGSNLKVTDDFSETVLHMACRFSNLDMVKQIISYGDSNIDSKDIAGRTPVMMAAKEGKMKVVRLLVYKGCNLKTVDYQGNNILHLACKYGRVNIAKYLIKLRGVEKNKRNVDGRTPQQEAELKGAGVVALFKSKV